LITGNMNVGHDGCMRSILNTEISFGLVRVPVRVFAATASHDRPMHQYHAKDAGRIRYERICEVEDAPVPNEEISRGVEDRDGNIVFINDEELDALPVSSRVIEVQQFVPGAQIDPIFYEKSYYLGLGPNQAAESYIVLRDSLAQSGLVALATVTMRQRESLAAIRSHGDVLVMETMLWADEVRLPELDVAPTIKQGERDLAALLIDAQTGDWHPEEYADDYQAALDALIEAKAEGREAPRAPKEPRPNVADLMEALQRSVAEVDPDRLPAKRVVRKSAKKATKRTPRKAAREGAKAAARKNPEA
jgi:DNA end-binding protein Ku